MERGPLNSDKIRVLIVDDHPVVRTGLVLMLTYEPDMEVVTEAANGRQAVAPFYRHRPDVTGSRQPGRRARSRSAFSMSGGRLSQGRSSNGLPGRKDMIRGGCA